MGETTDPASTDPPDSEWVVVRVEGRPGDGHDPLTTLAVVVLAAHKQAGLAGGSAVVGNLDVGAVDALGRPELLSCRIAIRASDRGAGVHARATLIRQGTERATRDGTTIRFEGETGVADGPPG